MKAGLDPQTIYDVVRVSTGTSFAFETRVPQILARDFSPGGTVDISFKDQELETAFAKQLGVPVLLANVSQQVYQMARAAGLNKEDGSAIIKVLERLAGVTVGGKEIARWRPTCWFTARTRAAGSGSRWPSGCARPATSVHAPTLDGCAERARRSAPASRSGRHARGGDRAVSCSTRTCATSCSSARARAAWSSAGRPSWPADRIARLVFVDALALLPGERSATS